MQINNITKKISKAKICCVFIVLLLGLFFYSTQCAQADDCSILNSSMAVPDGFGSPFNVLYNEQELMIQVDCHQDNIDIIAGNGQNNVYIYKYGYIYRDNQWQQFILDSGNLQYDPWIVGSASVSLTAGQVGLTESVLAYICAWTGDQWKCGCRDQQCDVNYWQVQMFTNNFNINACVDNDNDGYDNCSIGETGDDGNPIDCDDDEEWAQPGGIETCDTVDNDCNGQTDEGCDKDNDGYCDNAMLIYRDNSMCLGTVFTGGGMSGDDCDDNEANINPGVAEICDGLDNNCDGTADEECSCINGDTQTCGSDVGECQSGIQTCSSGNWGSCVGEIGPTAEICDGLDNNCDGTADEGCDIASPQIVSFNIQSRDIIDPVTVEWIVTDDSALKQVELWRAPDNIGNPGTWAQINTQTVSGVYAEGQFIDTPSVGSWWYGLHAVDQVGNWAVELSPLGPIQMACADNDDDGYDNCNIGDTGDDGNPIDCDDNEPWANPGGTETCDTVDNNCNGQTDEGCDKDNDGYCDNAMLIYSNNSMCPSTVFTGDGMSGDDCDDNEANINPGIAEICYNSIDDNCDLDIDCVDAGCAAHPSCIVDCSNNGSSNEAEFVAKTVPTSMSPGQEYAVSITIKNMGTSIWTRTCDFRLGSQSSQDNLMWGFRRVDLGGDDMIAPNETKTFIFNVTAPLTPGTYDFQWRMLRESVEWFGERTLFQIINVF